MNKYNAFAEGPNIMPLKTKHTTEVNESNPVWCVVIKTIILTTFPLFNKNNTFSHHLKLEIMSAIQLQMNEKQLIHQNRGLTLRYLRWNLHRVVFRYRDAHLQFKFLDFVKFKLQRFGKSGTHFFNSHEGERIIQTRKDYHYTVVQRQNAVSAYFTSKQILHFAFAEQHSRHQWS